MVIGAVVSCFFFFPLRCIKETAFPKCAQLCLFCCSSLGLSVRVSCLFLFSPLLVSAEVCEVKQVCLDFRTLSLTGTGWLIFPQNIQLDMDLDVCEFSLH